MGMNQVSSKPEVLFTALTGPGTFVEGRNYRKLVCSTYSFHPTMYLGYPGLIPKISEEQVKKSIEGLPFIGKAISDVMLFHDSDFVLRCYFGDFWPLMALCSGVYEPFTEGGKFLRQNRHLFFSSDTIKDWLSDLPRLKKNVDIDVVLKLLVAEKIVGGATSISFSSLDTKTIDALVGNPKDVKEKAAAILSSTNMKNIQTRMSDKELNSLLISIRLLL